MSGAKRLLWGYKWCPDCLGEGKLPREPFALVRCQTCSGEGMVLKEPRNVGEYNGSEVRISNH